jgi:hypothetical protein
VDVEAQTCEKLCGQRSPASAASAAAAIPNNAESSPPAPRQHQSGRRFASPMHRQRDGAAIHHVDQGRIAQHREVEAGEGLVVGIAFGDGRRLRRHGRQRQHVESAGLLAQCGDEGGAGAQQLYIVGAVLVGAAQDAQAHAWIVALALRSDQRAVMRVGFGRRKAALGVDAGDLGEARERLLDDLRAGPGQGGERPGEVGRDGRIEAVERDRLRHGDAQAGKAARVPGQLGSAHDLVQGAAAGDAAGERAD